MPTVHAGRREAWVWPDSQVTFQVMWPLRARGLVYNTDVMRTCGDSSDQERGGQLAPTSPPWAPRALLFTSVPLWGLESSGLLLMGLS